MIHPVYRCLQCREELTADNMYPGRGSDGTIYTVCHKCGNSQPVYDELRALFVRPRVREGGAR